MNVYLKEKQRLILKKSGKQIFGVLRIIFLPIEVDLFYLQLHRALELKLSIEAMAYFTSHVITRCRPGHSCQLLTEKIKQTTKNVEPFEFNSLKCKWPITFKLDLFYQIRQILHLGSISSRFGSPAVYPPPNELWAKERGPTKPLEIEASARSEYPISMLRGLWSKVDCTKQCGALVFNNNIENWLAN